MSDEVTAYPLTWPQGRPRTPAAKREKANFSVVRKGRYSNDVAYRSRGALTLAEGRERALRELDRLGAKAVVISTNIELKRDGMPYSGRRDPTDPGVAVYFQIDRKPRAIACDLWTTVADNLAAIAKTIEAQRGMIRWGAVTADQIFEGFKALPPVVNINDITTVEAAAEFFGNLSKRFTARDVMMGRDAFRLAHREAVLELHPDRNNGEATPSWLRLQQAVELLQRHHDAPK